MSSFSWETVLVATGSVLRIYYSYECYQIVVSSRSSLFPALFTGSLFQSRKFKDFFFQLRILVKKSQREGKEMGLYFCLALACVSMYANLCSGIQFYNCTPPVYVPENAIEENAIEKTLTLPSRIACASFVIRYQAIGFYFHGEFLNFIYYNSVEYFNHLL